MKRISFLFAAILALNVSTAHSATPEQEKAFVDAYKSAFESGDKTALAGFLYKEGSPEDVVRLFTNMQNSAAGGKIASIELVELTPAEVEKFNKPMQFKDGRSLVVSVAPYKQLVVVVEPAAGTEAQKKTLKTPIAEKDGNLVIPLLVLARK